MSGLLGACVCVKYLPDLSAPMSQSQHRLQELLAQGENTENTQRVETEHILHLELLFQEYGLHSNLGSLSLAVVVSPGTEQQKGTSTEHTSEHSVWLLREASGFAYTQLGFFRNHSCISGERLCDSE